MSEFPDHFSAQADIYSLARPTWPDSLFTTLVKAAPGTGLAVEVGCGSGQASIGLAEHFSLVLATDASDEQIARAPAHPRIRFQTAPAEQTGLPHGTADVVLAAQAAHWFRLPEFFAEAQRLLKPDGLLALASYSRGDLPVPECNRLLQEFHMITMAKWWPNERALVDAGYADIAADMPFEPIPSTELVMQSDWNLKQLMDYLATWSSVNRYMRAKGTNPLPELKAELRSVWPENGAAILAMKWPITLILGQNTQPHHATT